MEYIAGPIEAYFQADWVFGQDNESPHVTDYGHWITLDPLWSGGKQGGRWSHGNWTGGFWAGLLWLAYRHSGDENFAQDANLWAGRFRPRTSDETTNDLGILFWPPHALGLELTSRTDLRESALAAARTLLRRYCPAAGLIQARGPIGDPELGGSTWSD
jgi:unsaturated chondroitin disaccharide hydrolase